MDPLSDVLSLLKPRTETLRSALEGVKKLVLISSNAVGKRTKQHKAVIDAAKGAGVELIAYTSILHGEDSPDIEDLVRVMRRFADSVTEEP